MEKVNRRRLQLRACKQNESTAPNPLEESYAKDYLIQLGEDEPALPFQLHPANIDGWMLPHPQTKTHPHKPVRRTVHVRPHEAKTVGLVPSPEESIIPRLKLLLRKLESPEKRREAEQKQLRRDFLSSQAHRRKESVLVSQLMDQKRNSHQPSPRKEMASAGGPRELKRQQMSEPMEWAEWGTTIREARKSRTLRHLLF